MNILINGLQLSKKKSGVQYYCHHLYKYLQAWNGKKINIQLFGGTSSGYRNINARILRIVTENIMLPKFIRAHKFHLFHSPNYVLPLLLRKPSVLTVHDLITLDFPELCQFESVLYFRLFLRYSLKKADHIITVSETVKHDILKRYKIDPRKISVTHLGVSPLFCPCSDEIVLKTYRIPGKYFLFVGNIEPKKNLIRLLKAFQFLVEGYGRNEYLVIAGQNGWKYGEVYKTVKQLGLENRIVFTGYVPETDLPALYSMAEVFVFPSLYEGFGIPPLEAMACGTAVVASDRGALPEVTGGNCLLADPLNPAEIASKIYCLQTDSELKQEMIEKGRQWVKQFTWERTAEKTLAVYQSVYRDTVRGVEN